MKKNKSFYLLGGLLLSAGMMLWTSCTDEWNEHYNQEGIDLSAYPSLLERLTDQSDPDVKAGRFEQFVRVLEATGYDQRLALPALYTVFAPMDVDKATADKWIERFNAEKNTKQDDYNSAVKQFVQNHISLYAHNFVKTGTAEVIDTVGMLNGKYMKVWSQENESEWTVGVNGGTSDDEAHGIITEKQLCNNGFLYKITNGALPCYLNIKEALDERADVRNFLKYREKYDEYELDEDASVPGEIIDGNQVYIDSVVNYRNSELTSQYKADFHVEDSSYIFLVPNDDLWKTLYDEYSSYLNYKPTASDDDAKKEAEALTQVWTNRSIMKGRVFNLSKGYGYNLHYDNDSIVSTEYYKSQVRPYGTYAGHYYNGEMINPEGGEVDYRTYVWRKPMDGILNGLEKINCSNGYVYVDNNADDVLTRDNLYKTWFASQEWVGLPSDDYRPKTADVQNGTTQAKEDRFVAGLVTVNPEVDWIVCRKREADEPYLRKKIYDREYYLDTIGKKKYHFPVSRYLSVTYNEANDRIVKGGTKDYPTRVYYDFTLGDQILSNVYYNVYVITAPADANITGGNTKVQGLAFKLIDDYEAEKNAYFPDNNDATNFFYPTDMNYFDDIIVNEHQNRLQRDGYCYTGDSDVERKTITDESLKEDEEMSYYRAVTGDNSILNFYTYEEGIECGDDVATWGSYGCSNKDELYTSFSSDLMKRKIFIPKINDIDIVQVARAKKSDYANMYLETETPIWVLRVYNALDECKLGIPMASYGEMSKPINRNGLFEATNSSGNGTMRIAAIIVKPFKNQNEAENFTIKQLMEEYHIATTYEKNN